MSKTQLTKQPAYSTRPTTPLLKGIRRDWQLIILALPAVAVLAVDTLIGLF